MKAPWALYRVGPPPCEDDGRSNKTRHRPTCGSCGGKEYVDKLAQNLEDLDASEDTQTLWSSFKSLILETAIECIQRTIIMNLRHTDLYHLYSFKFIALKVTLLVKMSAEYIAMFYRK